MSTVLNQRALLSPAEVSEVLGVKEQTLAVWRCSGRHSLPFLKVGGSIRYRRADLEEWLAARTFMSTGAADAAGI